MNEKIQGAGFELLSGLFGWIWIGSCIAAVAFAGLALFGEGSWLNVLYAVIAGGVAKWLAKGFLDNRNRVAYEAELVSKGVSPEKAGQAWMESYTGQGKPEGNGLPDEEENQRKAQD